MQKHTAHLVDVVRFMPERIVRPEDMASLGGDELEQNDFFKAPKERRFAFPEYSAADLGTEAMKVLIKKTGINPDNIDAILYSCAITDFVNIGIGPDIQHRSGAKNATVLQIDTGCVSFISMLNVAKSFIESGLYKNIAIVTVTNFISRLEDFQKSRKSSVLGDGAAAALVTQGPNSFLSIIERSVGENYGLMICRPRGVHNEPQNYFDNDRGGLQVEFSEGMVDRLKANAINLVKDAVHDSIQEAGLTPDKIAHLITHQPNVALINEWRNQIGIQAPRAFDTFHQFGNLFQSTLPVTLSVALEQQIIKRGDTVACGTFANGGDFVGAMVLKW